MRRIVINPEILGGKPIVEGTRLSVEHILGLLAHGMSPSEIVESYTYCMSRRNLRGGIHLRVR